MQKYTAKHCEMTEGISIHKKHTNSMVILFVILFLVMVGFGLVIPILPFFITQLGGGPTTLGVFMAAYSLMQFFFAPFWGRLSDRILSWEKRKLSKI